MIKGSLDIRVAADYLAARSVCATCGATPAIKLQFCSYDDGWEVRLRCHGRAEEVFISYADLHGSRNPWAMLIHPFWPGFSVCRAKGRQDVGRRQLWRERKASSQRARLVGYRFQEARGRAHLRSMAAEFRKLRARGL